MNKKSLAILLLLMPIFIVIIVFITNAIIGMQMQADPEAVSESTIQSLEFVYGILGLIAIVCATVGGAMFIGLTRKK
jgi:hypothetical protein